MDASNISAARDVVPASLPPPCSSPPDEGRPLAKVAVICLNGEKDLYDEAVKIADEHYNQGELTAWIILKEIPVYVLYTPNRNVYRSLFKIETQLDELLALKIESRMANIETQLDELLALKIESRMANIETQAAASTASMANIETRMANIETQAAASTASIETQLGELLALMKSSSQSKRPWWQRWRRTNSHGGGEV
jgi:hypothetical protein